MQQDGVVISKNRDGRSIPRSFPLHGRKQANLINNYRLSRQPKDCRSIRECISTPGRVTPSNEFITNFRNNLGAERTGNLGRALV